MNEYYHKPEIPTNNNLFLSGLPIPNNQEAAYLDSLNPNSAFTVLKSLIKETNPNPETLLTLFRLAGFASLINISKLNLTAEEEIKHLLGVKDGIYSIIGITELLRQQRIINQKSEKINLPKPFFPLSDSEIDLVHDLQKTSIHTTSALSLSAYRNTDIYIRYLKVAPSVSNLFDRISKSKIDNINNEALGLAYEFGFNNSISDFTYIITNIHTMRQIEN